MGALHHRSCRRLILAVGLFASVLGAGFHVSAESPANGPTAVAHDTHGENHAGHTDPFSFVLIELAAIVVVAIFGRWMAGRCNQPAVLGELLIGVVLGNIGYWLGRPFFIMIMHMNEARDLAEAVWQSGAAVATAAQTVFSAEQLAAGGLGERLVQIMTGPQGSAYILMGTAVWMFSSLGVILLLFMVGLESSIGEMLKVGTRAAMVAIVGIVVPFVLGYVSSRLLLPDAEAAVHYFLAATLCATSVGITARVFKDLNALQLPEAKVILGAAVIDDVLGLIILAVVAGVAQTGRVESGQIIQISLMSVIFLGAVMLIGERFAHSAARVVGLLDRDNNKLLFPLALAFLLSWVANQIQLAPIVGAFAAGLILHERNFEAHSKFTMEELIAPLERIFAPVFFVLMGMQVNLASFVEPSTIWLALAFTVAAIIGKIVCGWPAGPGVDRLSIGIGMVPRGEVGLIFASIGRSLGVISDTVFSALVVMVMLTTLLTPPALKWSLGRIQQRAATP